MKALQLAIPILTLLCMTSCVASYYTPNSHNIPLITEDRETNVSTSMSFGETNEIVGLQLQASAGVSKHMAIKANIARSNSFELFVSNKERSNLLLQFGGGYFTKIKEHGVFECYGIGAIGAIKNKYRSLHSSSNPGGRSISSSANLYRIGIQPNIGYKSEYFSLAFSSRFTYLRHFNIKGEETSYLKDHASNFVIDPAIMIRSGFFKTCQLQLQYGGSINLTNPDFQQNKEYFSVGINWNFK